MTNYFFLHENRYTSISYTYYKTDFFNKQTKWRKKKLSVEKLVKTPYMKNKAFCVNTDNYINEIMLAIVS